MSLDPLEAARHLADILMDENEALKRLDFPAAVALTPAKEAALASLTQCQLAAPPPPLLPLARLLGRLAAENQVLLERAITVQTRIVRLVARACAPPAAPRYGGSGGRPPPSHRATALAVSTRA